MQDKTKIRKKYAWLRKSLADWEREEKNRQIRENLFASELFLQADNLYTYLSYGTEADTREIVLEGLKLGKRVLVPKVYPDRKMEFFQIVSIEELRPGFRGIPEPDLNWLKQKEPVTKPGLMLVPGLVFDRGGNRLGYGGGYYDTYFSRFPREHFYKLGLCFQLQVSETLLWTAEDTDIPMDGILTEAGTLRLDLS